MSLTECSDEELVAEIARRQRDRNEHPIIGAFCDRLAELFLADMDAETLNERLEAYGYGVADLEYQAVVDLDQLDAINEAFWRQPDQAPVVARKWLRDMTGRV